MENLRVAQPHWQGMGKSIRSSTCASSCKSCRPMPVWLTPQKEHARGTSHPGKRVRKIHQFESPGKSPQLPSRRFLDLENAFDTIPRDRLWARVSDAAKLTELSAVLEAGHEGTCYIIRNSLGRPVTRVHVTLGVRQGSVEGPLCFILLYALSITQARQKRPQQQTLIAVVQRGNTVSRLDLSALCFVDDLVSLLIFWKKSQLSRFAEMVSQVLETGRLRVNKSKLEVLVGAAGPGARRVNAEIACGAYQFTFQGRTIRATTVVRYLGCQAESQGSTRAEARMRVIKASKAQTRYSCGLWAPRSIGLSTKIRLWQTLVRSILLYAAEAHAWLPRDVETL